MKILVSLVILTNLMFAAVGNISSVRGEVFVLRGDKNIKAFIGQELEEKDIIVTQRRSNTQIIFNDDTSVNIGYNSNFSIEEYLVDNQKNSKVNLKINNGAIKVITGEIGKIAPKRFTLSTKTATIGIRGTNFLVFSNDKKEDIYCSSGEIQVKQSKQTFNVKQGHFVSFQKNITPNVKSFTADELKKAIDAFFENYVVKQNTQINSNKSENISNKPQNQALAEDVKSSNIQNSINSSQDNDKHQAVDKIANDDFISHEKTAVYSTKGHKFKGEYQSASIPEQKNKLTSHDYMDMTLDFNSHNKFVKKIDGYIGSGVETDYIRTDATNNVKFNKDTLEFEGQYSNGGKISGEFTKKDGLFIKDGEIKKVVNGNTLIDADFEASRKNTK